MIHPFPSLQCHLQRDKGEPKTVTISWFPETALSWALKIGEQIPKGCEISDTQDWASLSCSSPAFSLSLTWRLCLRSWCQLNPELPLWASSSHWRKCPTLVGTEADLMKVCPWPRSHLGSCRSNFWMLLLLLLLSACDPGSSADTRVEGTRHAPPHSNYQSH